MVGVTFELFFLLSSVSLSQSDTQSSDTKCLFVIFTPLTLLSFKFSHTVIWLLFTVEEP